MSGVWNPSPYYIEPLAHILVILTYLPQKEFYSLSYHQHDLIPVFLFKCSQVCREVMPPSAGFSALVLCWVTLPKVKFSLRVRFSFFFPLSLVEASITRLATETWLA